jgi:uncharacterized membrane protein YwzB
VNRTILGPLLQAAMLCAAGLAGMFYPFMPGSHDPLAVTISLMAQIAGAVGLLLVPIGLLWLIVDNKHHWFAFAALGASLIVGFVVAMAALQNGAVLAIAVVIGCACIVWWAVPAVKRMKSETRNRSYSWRLCLIVVPTVLFVARLAFLETAVEASRQRTIAGSAPFINAIESYRSAHGRYPPSLESVHHDYDPPTVGVERYRYEPYGESYNVFFEHPTFTFGMREFVMYNPRDEHEMLVHNFDELESPRAQVQGERAYHARNARTAGAKHWKYFWFD